ncbi:MAG: AAA family ATPase [Oscillospiraceae bacterium]|nr:AAA family ATPase [Oscillospiraceae bacterium]
MKILSMTATFGKLEHQTLTLEPGLNIIEAPNEWGKSTWCAFLVAMLYGIDTRERTTQDTLADKEHYAPWSGSPMSGRMELEWQGKNITIERSSKGRSIFGVFRAYETETGLDVPELTAANCGEVLLGVEKSVFTRAGFLKLTDLPVTQDKALWRRLNALVTTGDESGASDALAQKLRDLKNQCMSNRANGLIPQVLRQKKELEDTLSQLQSLQLQQERLQERQQQLEQRQRELSNHQAALAYEAAQSNAQRIQQAQLAQEQAQDQLIRLQSVCADYPERWVLEKQQHTLTSLQQESASLQMEQQMLPPEPQSPADDPLFSGMSPDTAVNTVETDRHAYRKAKKDSRPLVLALCSLLPLIAGLLLMSDPIVFISCILLFVLGCAGAVVCLILRNKRIQQLQNKYSSTDPEQWSARVTAYKHSHDSYALTYARWETSQADFRQRQEAFRHKLQTETDGTDLQKTMERIAQSLRNLDALEVARREMLRAENHAATLQALAKPVPAPSEPDTLTYTKEETVRLLSDCAYEQRLLIDSLGRCKGQMETLGQEEVLSRQLDGVNQRLQKLELTYSALELAQQTLTAASAELQRRFAPRISQRTQELFGKLTGSRYDRLTLGEDLSLQIGAEQETILRESRWRSDGTIDQLYLALRLAVAEELTPDAPLVLDDALVRFDDIRLEAAMQILAETAESKQIILFTCQSREKNILSAE